MALYPIKLLKDELGNPFMPIACEESIVGGKYTLTIFEAEKQSAGHYKIEHTGLTNSDLDNKIIGLAFDDVTGATSPSYLQLNTQTELPLYSYDGTTPLDLSNYDEGVALVSLMTNKWVLVKTGATGAAKHGITNTSHTLMTDRGALWFDKFEVSDAASYGATRIGNPTWSNSIVSGITGLISPDSWIALSAATITAPEAGTYRIILHLKLTDISEINREIGIKFGNKQDWCLQYKRLNHTFVIEDSFQSGDSFVPSIYVDKITSTDTINIEECDFYIEHINVQ